MGQMDAWNFLVGVANPGLQLAHFCDEKKVEILLMEEIPNNHLGCIKPCKEWDVYHVNWCRISSINRFIKKLKQENSGPINQYEPYLVNSALVTSDVSYEKQHIKVCQMYPPLHLNYHQIHMPTTHFLYYLSKKLRCSYTVCARLR